MKTLRALLVVPLVSLLALPACPGAQTKGGGGDVSVVLRRVDVISADFDKLTLHVIVAVENPTLSDVSVSAETTLAIVGEGTQNADDGANLEQKTEGAEGDAAKNSGGDDDKTAMDQAVEEAEKADAEVENPTGGTKPVDGKMHSGTGSGSAAASNTSELPITVEVPLPSDPQMLEQMLEWKKMLVYVDGKVKIGMSTYPIVGHREIAPPHLPTVKLKEAQIASVDDGRAGTGFFTIILDNKNPFQVTIDKMAWTVRIKDKELQPSSGTLEVTNDGVPASAVSEFQTEVQVNEASFGKELKALLKNPTVPYVIEGTLQVRGITRPFRFAGDMKFAR